MSIEMKLPDEVEDEIKELQKQDKYAAYSVKKTGGGASCIHIRTSNRLVPGVEDFYYHPGPDGRVTRHYRGFPESESQDEPPDPCCPECGKR